MNARSVKIAALDACAALIDVQASTDGDLWASTDGWTDADLERFQRACREIAVELVRRCQRLERGPRREETT